MAMLNFNQLLQKKLNKPGKGGEESTWGGGFPNTIVAS